MEPEFGDTRYDPEDMVITSLNGDCEPGASRVQLGPLEYS